MGKDRKAVHGNDQTLTVVPGYYFGMLKEAFLEAILDNLSCLRHRTNRKTIVGFFQNSYRLYTEKTSASENCVIDNVHCIVFSF